MFNNIPVFLAYANLVTYLLTYSHVYILEMLSHLKIIINIQNLLGRNEKLNLKTTVSQKVGIAFNLKIQNCLETPFSPLCSILYMK